MKTAEGAAISLVLGIAITALSGIVPSTPSGLLGARWYGLPTSWLMRLVIAPQYNPWRVQYANLLIDIIFWFVVIEIILYIYGRVGENSRRRK